MVETSENKKKLVVKHTLAGLTMTALSSAFIMIGLGEYRIAGAFLGFALITGIFYGLKEFPYWFQKVLDVWMFYTQIKPIAQIIREDSPKLDTSRQVITENLKLINMEMNKENPDIKMDNGEKNE